MLERAVLTSGVLLVLYAACGAPDSDGLFQPYAPEAAGAGAGGSGGSVPLPVRMLPMPLGDASVSEGQGGAVGLAGAAGAGPAVIDVSLDAGVPDSGDAAPSTDAAADCSSNLETCDGLDNDCDGATDEGDACAATCEGFALAGHGYMFCSDSVVRDTAADRCELEGMHLAWLETADENELVVARIADADVPAAADEEILTYIGGSDAQVEGNWIWRGGGAIADGVQFWRGQAAVNGGQAVGGAYVNWSPTEPNNTADDENCAVMSVLGNNNRLPGNWDDRNCESALSFVCEAP